MEETNKGTDLMIFMATEEDIENLLEEDDEEENVCQDCRKGCEDEKETGERIPSLHDGKTYIDIRLCRRCQWIYIKRVLCPDCDGSGDEVYREEFRGICENGCVKKREREEREREREEREKIERLYKAVSE